MKHKFLITNDVGLSLDKVNEVISLMRSKGEVDHEMLLVIDEVLIEVLAHLQQALDNLGEEE
jgi:hypothetical protein